LEDVTLHFFPLPHVFRGERREGVRVKWPDICARCDRQCENTRSADLELCSYGLNYLRVDSDLIIAGIAVSDFPYTTLARRKRLREVGRNAVTRDDLERLVETARAATETQERELQARRNAIVEEFRQSKGYHQQIVDLLRPELERTLAQAHDYKQFVQQIVQNMNVTLEKRFPGLPLEEKLDRASHEEAAIYWAATLMDEKLDALLFLDSPDRIHEPREQATFRLHGLVLKYIRVYQRRADAKRLRTRIIGESWAKINGNARALGIIPHTLIDNAIKYAPVGTEVNVVFREQDDEVVVAVESYGPTIRPDEITRIFDLFYRAEAARAVSSEGTGFGLASAQNIARAHNTEIVAQQGEEAGPDRTKLTTFSISFEIVGRERG
jgi:signal transduction histidine kinase